MNDSRYYQIYFFIILSTKGVQLLKLHFIFLRRVAEYAFEYAINNGRSKVTAVHKGGSQPFFWLRVGVSLLCKAAGPLLFGKLLSVGSGREFNISHRNCFHIFDSFFSVK